jgi:dUTPase
VFSGEHVTIAAGKRNLVDTKLQFVIPDGYYIQIGMKFLFTN